MKTISMPNMTLFATVLAMASCATTVAQAPRELVDARMTIGRVTGGDADRLVPAQVHIARRALDAAESAFAEAPSSWNTRDLAYVAQRKAQLAELGAQAALAEEQAKEMQVRAMGTVADTADQTRAEAKAAREQLDQAKAHQQQLLNEVKNLESPKKPSKGESAKH